ncbi:MAG: DUF1295 domain-containing protein, partial [Spirochaetia bacterium]|nr:DUF1295 domain-containing protein [Spirochaetia bacterium]
NPQLGGGRFDAKMFLYLVGAVLLELNLLSFAAHHFQTHAADPSPGVFLYTGLFTFFICEYLFFEEVHLYTYDFFAERVGFKLGWGCLAFYPYFYAVGLWGTAELPNPHSHPALLAISGIIFFSGWLFARGANMQKYFFKKNPESKFLGVLKAETLGSGSKKLLVNGFWGLSRHVNYLGEILMATGLALALGWPASLWPWLYPLYYVALLFPRQADDNKRCEAKYGKLWKEYQKRVRWKIIPGVY